MSKEEWCSIVNLELWEADTLPNEIWYLDGLEYIYINDSTFTSISNKI